MLPSRHANVHAVASPVRAGPASAEAASTPFARLERQLHRGAPRLGPERALADRVFSVVARAICSSVDIALDDITLEDSPRDDAALIAAVLSLPQPEVAPRPPAEPAASPVPNALRAAEAHGTAGTAASRSVQAVTSAQPVARHSHRVAGAVAVARPLHHHARSSRLGLGRAMVLGLLLAVTIVALTLNLLGVHLHSPRNPAAAEQGAHAGRRADAGEAPAKADEARRPPR